MKRATKGSRSLPVLFVVFGWLASILIGAAVLYAEPSTSIAQVSCYDDDSQDVINQDALSVLPLGRPSRAPDPADCFNAPGAAVNANGDVFLSGRKIYDKSTDPAIEAKISPTGVIAFRTQSGSMYEYDAKSGLRVWYETGLRPVSEFKMARDGTLIARTMEGTLLVSSYSGRVETYRASVVKMVVGSSGRTAALMDDGRIIDSAGLVYDHGTDPAKAIKLTASDSLFWLTERGRILVSEGTGTPPTEIHTMTTSPAVSFKVTAGGCIAYLDSDGKLWRSGELLTRGVTGVSTYRILPGGHVAGVDREGRHFFYENFLQSDDCGMKRR